MIAAGARGMLPAMRSRPWGVFALSALLASCNCGGGGGGGGGGTVTPPNETILLDRTDQLTLLDPRAGTAAYDDYLVQVNAGDRIEVSLTSAAFDPVVEVTPPGASPLVNDDYQGNRQASYLEVLAP